MQTATARGPPVTRRAILGAAAVTAVGSTSGCVRRLRSIVNRESAETVSLTVTAPPADSDRLATLIARHIVSNLEAVGISTTLNVLPQSELLREMQRRRTFLKYLWEQGVNQYQEFTAMHLPEQFGLGPPSLLAYLVE